MKTFDLTPNELKAALVLVKECLDGMGGKRPGDLEHDEYTWIAPEDLIKAGWGNEAAAGTWGALEAKGIIQEYAAAQKARPGRKAKPAEYILTTAAWRWLDTVWDANL